MSDPDVGVSVGTAVMLGLLRAPMLVPPTTAYLMVGGRCARDCGFCAQARSSKADETMLSRVTWPPFPARTVIDALAAKDDIFQRVCIQSTSTPDSFERTLRLVAQLKAALPLPVDASLLPPNASAIDEAFAAGLDHLGFGLDAASEAVFAATKGSGWAHYRSAIWLAAERYRGRAAAHLIAGLGESELEMALAMQEHADRGITVGLFAFCPVAGTRLGQAAQPSLAGYRRLQAARYLIANSLGRAVGFAYDEDGRITDFAETDVSSLISGEAFRTSGCPGCNRPFYNERPSGPLYNYPRPLTSEETALALREAGVEALAALVQATCA